MTAYGTGSGAGPLPGSGAGGDDIGSCPGLTPARSRRGAAVPHEDLKQ